MSLDGSLSLVNMIMAGGKHVTPEVGMGVTFLYYSDRAPGTIVEIINEKKIVVQYDDFKRTDNNGFSESQTYEYTRNPKSQKVVVRLRKNGRWVVQGEPMRSGLAISIGQRKAYWDPTF